MLSNLFLKYFKISFFKCQFCIYYFNACNGALKLQVQKNKNITNNVFTKIPTKLFLLFPIRFIWKVIVAQSCPTLCDPIDSPWNSPGQNTGVGSLSLLQGIFPTQRLNPGLPHCRFFTSWAAREAQALYRWYNF